MPLNRYIIRNTALVSIRHFRIDTDFDMSGIQMLYKLYVFFRGSLSVLDRCTIAITEPIDHRSEAA